MKTKAKHNFHLPLPLEIYEKLRDQSEKQSTPATVLARTAIVEWLEQQEKAEIDNQIRSFAQSMAGTDCDLDEALEEAAVELLLETGED
mgnify:CR=1 FL=1